jgi:hypothetical protein
VVVVALPPVGPSKAPPLHHANSVEIQCAQKPGLAFASEGAPLVFATDLAHDLKLHIDTSKGGFDIPVTAESSKGALVPVEKMPALPNGDLTAVLRGKWGFDDWEGPRFHLSSPRPEKWAIASDDQSALVVGRDDTLHIQGDSSECVSSVDLAGAMPLHLNWKSPKPDALEVAMPMKHATPGPMTLEIHQYGLEKPDTLILSAYVEAASLDRLSLSVGDKSATLKGTRLDEVAKATLSGITWTPATLTRVQDFDQLSLNTEASTADLDTDSRYSAKVLLHDGRELKVPVHVEPPRPQVTLLSKGAQDDGTAKTSVVQLGSADDLLLSGKFVFFLKSLAPQKFPRNQDVEIAAVDGSFRTVLSLSDGSLILEDARTALGVVDPMARFGPSAFGPVRARAVSADGVPGDWLPLGTLVRLPVFKELHCPHTPAKACILTGSNLFLIDLVSATSDLANSTEVPPDFTGAQLAVPHPVNGALYFKLRDDPNTVQILNMPVTLLAPAAATAASAAPAASAAAQPAITPPPLPAASSPADPSPAKPGPKTN